MNIYYKKNPGNQQLFDISLNNFNLMNDIFLKYN